MRIGADRQLSSGSMSMFSVASSAARREEKLVACDTRCRGWHAGRLDLPAQGPRAGRHRERSSCDPRAIRGGESWSLEISEVSRRDLGTLREGGSDLGKRWPREVGRGGIEPPTLRFSGGCSYRLSYLPPARPTRAARAVPTGFEPATSALTGRRELLASPRDLAVLLPLLCRLLSCLRTGVLCVPPTGFEPVLPP